LVGLKINGVIGATQARRVKMKKMLRAMEFLVEVG
jgi:NAD/NADP transhydrogenase beta subunit